MINVIDRNELYEFICLESELIDDRRFPEWLDLFTEDSIYWVPAMHDQKTLKRMSHCSTMTITR